jgi:hypothetical protein
MRVPFCFLGWVSPSPSYLSYADLLIACLLWPPTHPKCTCSLLCTPTIPLRIHRQRQAAPANLARIPLARHVAHAVGDIGAGAAERVAAEALARVLGLHRETRAGIMLR